MVPIFLSGHIVLISSNLLTWAYNEFWQSSDRVQIILLEVQETLTGQWILNQSFLSMRKIFNVVWTKILTEPV